MSWRVRNVVSGLLVPSVQFDTAKGAWDWIALQERPQDFSPEWSPLVNAR